MKESEQEAGYAESKYVRVLMEKIIGCHVDVAVGAGEYAAKDEIEYQIMCDGDHEFFDWYCWVYGKNQWHDRPMKAALEYLMHRDEWIKLNKPYWQNCESDGE
jgi:hypothetical protein